MTKDDIEKSYQTPYASLKPENSRLAAAALSADKSSPDKPARVIAAGHGKIAEAILDIAFKKGIKVREDADLAELLAVLELDTPIPTEAILAVGEILAKVYEANHELEHPNRMEKTK